MRRVCAPADHRSKSPSVGAGKSKAPLPGGNRWHGSGNGDRGDSPVGRDWFPGGPYSPPGRGSIPRRSTCI